MELLKTLLHSPIQINTIGTGTIKAKLLILTVTGSYTPTVDVSVYQYPWYYNADTGTYQDFYYTANTPVFTVDVYNGAGYDDATNVTIKYVIGNGLIYDGYDNQGIGTVTFNNSTNTLTWIIPYHACKWGSFHESYD